MVHCHLCYGFCLLMANHVRQSILRFNHGYAIANQIGDRIIQPWIINGMAFAAMRQGDVEGAMQRFEQARRLWRDLGDTSTITVQFNIVGYGAEMIGDYRLAKSLYEEVLRMRQEMGNRRLIASSLETFAGLAATQHDDARAMCLLSSAESIRNHLGISLSITSHADHVIAQSRNGMSEGAINAAWAEGSAMTIEQAIKYALQTA